MELSSQTDHSNIGPQGEANQTANFLSHVHFLGRNQTLHRVYGGALQARSPFFLFMQPAYTKMTDTIVFLTTLFHPTPQH